MENVFTILQHAMNYVNYEILLQMSYESMYGDGLKRYSTVQFRLVPARCVVKRIILLHNRRLEINFILKTRR